MYKSGLKAILAAFVVVGSAGASTVDDTNEAPVQLVCEAAGHAPGACSCIAREASSRFSHDQLDIVGAAMPDLARITDDPQLKQSGGPAEAFTTAELEQLRLRAETADVVIRQACGLGLRLRPAG